jgi:hypothetical protein
LAGAAWYLVGPRLSSFQEDLPAIIGVAALLGFAGIAVGLGLIALSALTGRRMFFSQRITATVVRILFPLVFMLSRIIGVEKDRVKRSFIAVNNALVCAGRDTLGKGKLLLLLPHCLQSTECPNRITGGLIENCQGCGKCVISSLLVLAKKHDLALTVATGGTLARRVIGEVRPSAIIRTATRFRSTEF